MANAYRPDTNIVKACCWTVGEGLWALTADLIEAVAHLMKLITELLGKTTLVKVGTALTLIVDSSAVGKDRSFLAIESRKSLEGKVVENGAQ